MHALCSWSWELVGRDEYFKKLESDEDSEGNLKAVQDHLTDAILLTQPTGTDKPSWGRGIQWNLRNETEFIGEKGPRDAWSWNISQHTISPLRSLGLWISVILVTQQYFKGQIHTKNKYLSLESESVSHSVVSNCLTPWTIAHQASLSIEFSRQDYWSGLPFHSPGGLPDAGIKLRSLALAGGFFTVWATREALKYQQGVGPRHWAKSVITLLAF